MGETMSRWTDRFSLAGKRALVTGASKGIGLETCQVLADAGADIVAVARDRAGLKGASDSVEACGRRGGRRDDRGDTSPLQPEADIPGIGEQPVLSEADAIGSVATEDMCRAVWVSESTPLFMRVTAFRLITTA